MTNDRDGSVDLAMVCQPVGIFVMCEQTNEIKGLVAVW
jgi:hypothetical protein